ncbi:protein of unknown function (plasmid) [Cupriavidus taiwanensis]|uniref:Uncharacterized protein n=1 Tax=Cupriavidus taiwanensis TaxID=164546 RepID=A0A7Z7JIJ6_9BURK|nr:hypothetical protein CBM2597_U20012 [Cupriavidus taiwanensis]SOZ96714.1 hypothetical protein CBM2598_U20014 [Cupriavidus taiwanensis]SPC26084.1 hypothetical protein CBM2594_U30106 [Cupriavidus taiwanensis]SPD37880.1 protein of unknown function [Cupriavidus taiwanensis]
MGWYLGSESAHTVGLCGLGEAAQARCSRAGSLLWGGAHTCANMALIHAAPHSDFSAGSNVS